VHFLKKFLRDDPFYSQQRRDAQTRVRRKDNNLFGVFFRQRVTLSHSFIVVILFSSSQKQGREKERVLRESFLLEREREIPNENLYIPRLCLFFLAIYRIHGIVFARNSEKNKTERNH